MGGTGPKRTLRWVARWADHWDCFTPKTADVDPTNEVLLEHCADVGRDPSSIPSIGVRLDVGRQRRPTENWPISPPR